MWERRKLTTYACAFCTSGNQAYKRSSTIPFLIAFIEVCLLYPCCMNVITFQVPRPFCSYIFLVHMLQTAHQK